MNLLFINPPFIGRFSRSSRSPAVAKGGTLYYPLWLAYAAGVSEAEGHNIRFYDAPSEGLSIDDIFIRMGDFYPDIVVLDTSTPSIFADVDTAEKIKKKFSNSFVILVGTHPSALPEETLKMSDFIDAVAIGEYDYSIRDLADAFGTGQDLGTVDGIAFKRAGKIVRNKHRRKIEDLDKIPFVSRTYKKYLNYKNFFCGGQLSNGYDDDRERLSLQVFLLPVSPGISFP